MRHFPFALPQSMAMLASEDIQVKSVPNLETPI